MDGGTKRGLPDNHDAGGPSTNSTPRTLTHPISPPTKKRRLPDQPEASTHAHQKPKVQDPGNEPPKASDSITSPFRLTRIRDLPADLNRDTVSLTDLLGDPLISECWEFNYLHDLNFLLSAFDHDVRHLVKIHVVHGFWKRDSEQRQNLEAQAASHANIVLHKAYLPEMFGTHHTKMMILLRHDDTAQIIIHTANMIPRDWANMTQAVWSSPRLPLLPPGSPSPAEGDLVPGSGAKFKIDFLTYLRAYSNCRPIASALANYDFSAIRGHLIASVPGRHPTTFTSPRTTQFGWSALPPALRTIPASPSSSPEIAIQMSSIATLGGTDAWLRQTFFRALSHTSSPAASPPSFKVVFPTPDEIRASLDGYVSGGSIHTKIQSAQQQKQLAYLRPMFCHWDNEDADADKNAGRGRAAPHIKTYIRYSEAPSSAGGAKVRMDWALLTSANLSKQAWGEARNAEGKSRVSSFELGVLVWPGLWGEGAVMEGVFGRDDVGETEAGGKVVVPLRMPYSLPLKRYGQGEMPWVATMDYGEVDWMGRSWEG